MCACEEHIWLVCAHARCDTDALASDTNDLRRLVERMVPFWPSRNRVYSGRELRVCVCACVGGALSGVVAVAVAPCQRFSEEKHRKLINEEKNILGLFCVSGVEWRT